jgi:SAM-dependent methyltransferase
MATPEAVDDPYRTTMWWDDYFSESGAWERNGGRAQSRLFAEYFLRHFEIDRASRFSLLDVGCALGDSIEVFARTFPQAKLHGMDFSGTAVKRCRDQLGGKASFTVGDISAVKGHFNVIFCSNTLEHFVDFDAKAKALASHCDRLCVLVPYRELENGKPIQPGTSEHHQHTFDDHSFDFLVDIGVAESIQKFVFSVPGAWGWSKKDKLVQPLKNVVRYALGRKVLSEPFQILYDIKMK